MITNIKRMLRIINISPEKASVKCNIPNILTLIDKTYTQVLNRIMANPNDQFPTKLTKITRARSTLQFITNKFNTKAYIVGTQVGISVKLRNFT